MIKVERKEKQFPQKSKKKSSETKEKHTKRLKKDTHKKIKRKVAKKRPRLDNLPVEVIIRILTYVDVGTLLNISQCNRMLRQLGSEDVIWRLLCNNILKSGQKKPRNILWKEFYKRIYLFRRGIIYPVNSGKEYRSALNGVDPNRIFQVQGQITLNGHNSVHKGIHSSTREIVCISKIDYQEGMLPFVKKKSQLLQFHNSPLIVSQYGIYFDGNFVWLVSEFCSGGSLRQNMDLRQQTFTESEIAFAMRSVLSALDFIHSNNIYHGNLSASSIMLHRGKNGRVTIKLRDKTIINSFTEYRLGISSAQARKTYWKPPEFVSSIKGDIWSLGITCIELAEGKPPHWNITPSRARSYICNRPPPSLLHPTQWSHKFKDFLEHCLRKDKESRSTARELLEHPFIVDNFAKYKRCKLFKRFSTVNIKSHSISRRKLSSQNSISNDTTISNTDDEEFSFGLTLSSSYLSLSATEDSHDL